MEREMRGLQLDIPASVVQAIRLPEERLKQELLVELGVTLYAQGLLSFGKARELAGMGKFEFGQLLGRRGILRHYGREELEDDLTYARRE
jgi:predicted HTH domain antitoxin